MTRFIPIVFTACFARVNPVSTKAKPTCMNMTRNPPSSTQTRLSDCSMSSSSRCDGRLAGRWWPAAGEDDQGAQSGEDGDHQERHGQAPGDPAPPPPGGEWIAQGNRGRVAQILQKRGCGLV